MRGRDGGRGEVVTLALHLMWVRKLSHSRNNNKFRNFFFSDHFVFPFEWQKRRKIKLRRLENMIALRFESVAAALLRS